MADENLSPGASEAEIAARIEAVIQPKELPPLGQTPQPAEETEAPQEGGETQETEEEPGEPEEFEWEFEGEKYKLPTKLKPLTEAQMRQADYTRKTQEIAEHRKFLEEQTRQLQSAVQFQQAAHKDFGELQSLESKLEQFKSLNWAELWDKDPVEAGKLRIMRDEIKDARDRLTTELSQKQQQFQAQQQQHLNQMIAKGQEILRSEIKGWSKELATSIRSNAAEHYGFTETELGTVIDPRMVKMMHDAYQFQRMKAANLTSKMVQPSAKTIKPGTATNASGQRSGKITEAAQKFRKSGSVEDMAGLLMARWKG